MHRRDPLPESDRAVIVAMAVVAMMQVAVDDVIDVVSVWNRWMAAAGSVDVVCGMRSAVMTFGTVPRVGWGHGKHVLVDVIAMSMMQMAVVEIIDVAVMLDRRMSAIVAVNVGMPLVNSTLHHVIRSYHTCTLA
jgi:hypothetical protein